MNPKPKKEHPSSAPEEDDRPTLPDINVDDEDEADTLPRRRDVRPEDEIASATRPPSDS